MDPVITDGPDARESFVEGERARRLTKLDALRGRGIEPYPVRFDRDARAAELHARYGDLPAGADAGATASVAGRVVGLRRHGGIDFVDVRDETGTIQLLADRSQLGDEALHDVSELDLGDWVGATGRVVVSRRGELSIQVTGVQLLAKALRALPDLRHGLADPETRYRQRYLDLIANERTRRIFDIRTKAIASVRQTLLDRGFQEVETPVLLPQAGGAAARPFITHHNALDLDMTLRIALELPLKRLIVGGMDRVFEIGRVFRNEGLDTRHNPEFTELEAYQAFADYHDMMELTEAIVSQAAIAATGSTVVRIGDRDVDLKPPWRRATMAELIKENAGVDMHPSMPVDEARRIADELGVEWLEVWGSGKIMSEVYEASSEHLLIEPTFVLDHPREVSPLAKAHRDDPALVERFELVVAGRELANAYSELNDPVDQAQRFRDEARLQAGGDDEAEPVDDDYVEALEYGLPPTGGLGIGIDRLVMLLAGVDSIREVILFPTLRPVDGDGAGDDEPDDAEHAPAVAPEGDAPVAAVAPAEPPATPIVAPTRRPRSLKRLAWLTAIVGLLSLLPSLPLFDWSFGFGDLLERESRAVAHILSVAVGAALIAIAVGIGRGRRAAWGLALALFAAAAILHLFKGPDPFGIVADLAMVIALVWFRHDFRGRGEPGTLWDAVVFVPSYLLGVLVFGAVSLLTQASNVTPSLGVGGVLETVYGGLIGLDGPYTFHRKLFADWFTDALLALGILGAAILLYLLLRPFAERTPPSAFDRERALRIVRAHGRDTLDYFALRRDKSWFFSADGRSLIAYAYVRGHALVAGDPIGPPEDRARTIDEFLAFCAERGWGAAFLAVREDDAPIYRDRGMHVIYLGDEAILHPDRFTLEGRKMKAVREAVNRVGRDHAFELITEDQASPELVAQLNAISELWRQGAEERGFTMELGEDVEGTEADFLLAIARRKDTGEPVGFLRFVPAYDPRSPGYSLDLMRRRPDSVNGLTEFLIASTALEARRRGVRRLSLNFAAWGRLLDSAGDAGLAGRLERRLARGLNPFFQIQSLRDFNQKFDPEWLPRSIVVDDLGDLPKVALLWASVEGFLDVPLIGRLLVPPVRRATASEH